MTTNTYSSDVQGNIKECASLNLGEMEKIIDPDLEWVLRFCDKFYNAPEKKIIYAVQRNNGSDSSCYTMKHYSQEKFCRNMDHCLPFNKNSCYPITKEEFITIWRSCMHCP